MLYAIGNWLLLLNSKAGLGGVFIDTWSFFDKFFRKPIAYYNGEPYFYINKNLAREQCLNGES